MHLIARVFDQEITEEELLEESSKLIGGDASLALAQALNRLIDRNLLLHQALKAGITLSDEEFDNALFEALEELDNAPSDDENTRNLELTIKHKVIIRKYVQQLCAHEINIGDEQLFAFYEDQKAVFHSSEQVRASHILIKGHSPESENLANELHAKIKTQEDFSSVCGDYSQCPTGVRCGDLGWFPRGKLLPEIEEVAFSLQPGEISDVFRTPYGFHILLVTDRKEQQPVPFGDIKDSLKSRLALLEKEFILIRHVNDLRKKSQDHILIYDRRFSL